MLSFSFSVAVFQAIAALGLLIQYFLLIINSTKWALPSIFAVDPAAENKNVILYAMSNVFIIFIYILFHVVILQKVRGKSSFFNLWKN